MQLVYFTKCMTIKIYWFLKGVSAETTETLLDLPLHGYHTQVVVLKSGVDICFIVILQYI